MPSRMVYAIIEEVIRSVARKVGGVWVDPNEVVFLYDEGSF